MVPTATDPNGWITMSLARWPIRAARIERRPRWGVPRIADHDMPAKVRGRASSTLTDPQRRSYVIQGCAPMAAAQESNGFRCRTPVRMSERVESQGAAAIPRMAVYGATETLAAASPAAAAAVMRRDGSTSVAAALSTGSGSPAGVVREAAVTTARRWIQGQSSQFLGLVERAT